MQNKQKQKEKTHPELKVLAFFPRRREDMWCLPFPCGRIERQEHNQIPDCSGEGSGRQVPSWISQVACLFDFKEQIDSSQQWDS